MGRVRLAVADKVRFAAIKSRGLNLKSEYAIMNLKYAALAALSLCAAPIVSAATFGPQYQMGVDHGTGLSTNGIVPNPGEGYAPFWAGNTRDFSYVATTQMDGSGNLHAFRNGVDLTPSAYQFAGAVGVLEGQNGLATVGYVGGTCGGLCLSGPTHAALWPAAGGFVDLHPAFFASSLAHAVDYFGNVAGWAKDDQDRVHAILWRNDSPFEPLPEGAFVQTAATALSDAPPFFSPGTVGGYGIAADGRPHPVIWGTGIGGTFVSMSDVLPKNGISGVIAACDPVDAYGDYAGSLITTASGGQYHATLWLQTSVDAPIDLHPSGPYLASSVYAMRSGLGAAGGFEQAEVGLAVAVGPLRRNEPPATAQHAMVWWGLAASAVDLHKLLSKNFIQSTATGIDDDGTVEGAAEDTQGVWHIVSWTPRPPKHQ